MNRSEALTKFKLGNNLYYQLNTQVNYGIDILQFYDFHPEIDKIENFNSEHVENWLEHLKELGLKSNSICNKYYAVKALFDFLNEETDISVNPTVGVELPKRQTGFLQVIDRQTLFAFRELMKNNLRDRTLLETILATGARVQELSDMRLDHVYLEDRQIIIPKGKDLKPRIVLFTPNCKEWLSEYIDSRTDTSPFLFITRLGGPFHRMGIWQLFREYSKRANLDKNISPHAFRRTFACILYKYGVPIEFIKELMGHASIKNTQRYILRDYLDLV